MSSSPTDPTAIVRTANAPTAKPPAAKAPAAKAPAATEPAAKAQAAKAAPVGDPTGPILLVGLGNPGAKYAATRHNVGFWAADALAKRAGVSFTTHKKSGALAATARLAGRSVILLKPQSFMNLSGQPTAAAAKFFSVDPLNVIALHDELDIDFGKVRLKRGGGEGGHNGLRSISQTLGTKDYLRVRIGIGRPPGRMDAADYVLKPFGSNERPELDLLIENACDAAELLITQGLEAAQNTVHAWT